MKLQKSEACLLEIQEFYNTLAAHMFSNLPLTFIAAMSDKELS